MSNFISFRNFIWPMNPEQLQVQCKREAVYGLNDEGKIAFLGLSEPRRVITGKGVFLGEMATETYGELEVLFQESIPGNFIGLEAEVIPVYFTELTQLRDSREYLVGYSFTFREVDSSGGLQA